MRLAASKLICSLLSVLAAGVLQYSLVTVLAWAQDTQESGVLIDSARVEGNRVIASEAIVSQLPRKSGYLTSSELERFVKGVYQTGYFDQVRLVVVPSSSGGRELKVALTEKPLVRKVLVKGNDGLSEKDIAEVISFGQRRFLDRVKIKAAKDAITTLYQSKGYYDAKVEHQVTPIEDHLVDLTFIVTEGVRYKIEEVQFVGLSELDADELREVVQTKSYKWWSSWLFGTGRVNQEMLENDKRLIKQHLLDRGYLENTVGDASVKKVGEEMLVTFEVKEGSQYKVGEVAFSGDLGGKSESDLRELVKVKPGRVFSASEARASSFAISDSYGDKGYAFANITPLTTLDRTNNIVNLTFEVDRGPVVNIGRINIVGNDKTYDNVIRRELRFNELEQYSSSKIKRSRDLLERRGYFDEVNISTQPTAKKDEVDALVSVREGSTGTFSVGAGYSTSDGVLFNSRLTERNIMGTGRSATLNVDVGTLNTNFILGLEDPRVNDTFWSAGTNIFQTEQQFQDYDRNLAGAGLSAGYPLDEVFGEFWQDIAFSTRYEYQDIEIDNVDRDSAAPLVLESEGSSTASVITPRFIRNTINNPLNPVNGSRQTIGVSYAGLGGSDNFIVYEVSNSLFYPLLETEEHGNIVFSWRTDFDWGENIDDGAFPLYRRFFPGGINSIRGYEVRTMGPKDEDGNEYGGSKQFINNFELIFPLIESAGIRFVTFYDIGEAFDDEQDIELSELRAAYGAGIRWNSPMGPFRIELGFPLDREDGDDASVTMFSFGAPL